jgi:protein-tyrosine phosphatase
MDGLISDHLFVMDSKFRLLFVCLGNICRSPAAEGVMRRLVEETGLGDRIEIDSAGTAGWHEGKRADPRMRKASARRGLDLTHLARQVHPTDLAEFDLVLAMDRQNQADLLALDSAGLYPARIRLLCEFCTRHEAREVPDPYYGGEAGFEHVLDLLEDACTGLLDHVRSRIV